MLDNYFSHQLSAILKSNLIFPKATKLYSQVLVSLLNAESRKAPDNYKKLLLLGNFQTAIFALALEIVIFSSACKQFTYEAVVAALQLDYFDCLKVIQFFSRFETFFIGQQLQHLSFIEERILEELIWRSASLLELLSLQKDHSFYKDYYKKLHSGEVELPKTPPRDLQKTPPRGKELFFFYRKIYRLFLSRLGSLAGALEIPPSYKEKIRFLIESSLVFHPDLFFDRHVDQIIICCIYGAMRLAPSVVPFRVIIERYRSLYRDRNAVYKRVPLQDGQRGHIIRFYNTIFIPRLKKSIFSLEKEDDKLAVEQSLLLAALNHTCSFSEQKVLLEQNVFLSPKRPKLAAAAETAVISASSHATTPRSHGILCFGDSSPLSSPSKAINMINERVNKKKKSARALKF
ncbi:retinoblastoma-like protein 2 [Zophobas morio]|uniref:retinoblastoma-like protein 2 n=1 Tax=Zophobas morio TaxID=2755281 RepID=UPI003083EAF6